MKRFLLFGGESFYPEGGWEDFHDSYDSLDEAGVEAAKQKRSRRYDRWDWAQCVDRETWKFWTWAGLKTRWVEEEAAAK